MTNVKLKLTVFLLSAILTADVCARPYSTNTSDIIIKYNDTFHLPVDSYSDTLTVADEKTVPETSAEIDKNSNTDMKDIMNSESARDAELAQKNIMNSQNEMENPDKELSHLDAIMDAEQDRDEEISEKRGKTTKNTVLNNQDTDMRNIMEAEQARETSLVSHFAPRFEFLIAAKENESEARNKIVFPDSDNNLDKLDRNVSDVLRKMEYVELVEVLKPGKMGENKSSYYANITGHEVDNDLAPDTSFTDMQTLILACLATLLPLLLILCATLLIRYLCRRYCPGWCRKPSTSSASDTSEKNSSQSQEQLKSPNDESPGSDAGETAVTPPANGSIFTMTLKNNHLIVEAEERSDITKNGRETKMKYSPDNDGIFVVEVQQSNGYRPNNKNLQNSPPHDPQISTNQALIHRIPEELERKILEDESEKSSSKFDKALALSSTGLSISDLSMSSVGSHGGSYSYGCQMGYEQGPFGYPLYAGYDTASDNFDGINHESQEPLISKTPTDPDKPVVTAAIFKQDSLINNDSLQGQVYSIEGSTDGPLLSDVQAREVSIQNIHDKMEKKIENGVAVPIPENIETPMKPVLNRADSLPVQLEENKAHEPIVDKNNAMETISEDVTDDMSKDFSKAKRGSLPIIRNEVYENVKDAMIPSVSPKFEKLTNDSSPGDDMNYDAPPMITITEEIDSGKIENAS